MRSLVRSTIPLWSLPLLLALSAPAAASEATLAATAPPKVVGYFTAWGIYDQGYTVKSLVTSGSAPLLTHINYAFGNVAPGTTGSQVVCQIGDPWADYQKTWTAAESVNGVAVTSGALRGNFQQLKVLKARYPNLKLLISLGGRDWSRHFSDMAVTPASRAAFVTSCINLFIRGNLPRDLDAGDFTRYYDPVVRNAWLYDAAAREFWTFDNPQTQAAKAAYVKSKRLGGMMFWDLSGDTANGELIKAIAKALK